MSLTYFYDPFPDPFYEFNRLFDAAWDSRTSGSREVQRRDDTQSVTGALRPRLDLHESKEKNQMTATFELPGLKKEDINIDIHNNRLLISGQNSMSSELDNDGYAVRERRYGRFSRAIPLPVGTKPEEVKANMESGVLKVTFPRTQPETEAKKITIS